MLIPYLDNDINHSLSALNINHTNSNGVPETLQVARIVSALAIERQRQTAEDTSTGLVIQNPFKQLSLDT